MHFEEGKKRHMTYILPSCEEGGGMLRVLRVALLGLFLPVLGGVWGVPNPGSILAYTGSGATRGAPLRANACAASYRSEDGQQVGVLLFGGRSTSGNTPETVHNDIYFVDIDTGRFTLYSPRPPVLPPAARSYTSCGVLADNKFFTVGGSSDHYSGRNGCALADSASFDPVALKWNTSTGVTLPTARLGQAFAVDGRRSGNSLFLYGGITNDLSKPHGDLKMTDGTSLVSLALHASSVTPDDLAFSTLIGYSGQAASAEATFFLFGGITNNLVVTNAFYRVRVSMAVLPPTEAIFESLALTMSPRTIPMVGYSNSAQLLFGAFGGGTGSTVFGDLWDFNLTGNTWNSRCVSGCLPGAGQVKDSAGVQATNKAGRRVLFFHGGAKDPVTLLDETWYMFLDRAPPIIGLGTTGLATTGLASTTGTPTTALVPPTTGVPAQASTTGTTSSRLTTGVDATSPGGAISSDGSSAAGSVAVLVVVGLAALLVVLLLVAAAIYLLRRGKSGHDHFSASADYLGQSPEQSTPQSTGSTYHNLDNLKSQSENSAAIGEYHNVDFADR
jgi:hypothetical protein